MTIRSSWTIGSAAMLVACTAAALGAQTRSSRPRPAGAPAQAPPARTAPPPAPPEPQVGGGHIPSRGPTRSAEPARTRSARPNPESPPAAQPDQTRAGRFADRPGHPVEPHVDANNDRWIGHTGRRDENYRLATPWAHGRFPGRIGARTVYRLNGGSVERFGFGGVYFSVAPYDYDICRNWLWDRDDVVLYDDLDHPGYYLAYNVRTGTYCHVEYLGP